MENPYQPYVIKKANKKHFCLKVLLLSFLIVVTIAFLLIKVVNLSLFSFLYKSDEKECFSVHLVCKNVLDSESSINEVAKSYRARGGAGVVFKTKTNVYVVLSCYLSYDKAKNVVTNLNAAETNMELIEIKIEQPSLKKLTEEDRAQFITVFKFLKDTVATLDELILGLADNSITDVAANSKINNLLLKSEFYEQKLLEKEKLETTSYVLSSVSNILYYACGETALTENYLSYQAEIRRALVRIVLVLYENFGI